MKQMFPPPSRSNRLLRPRILESLGALGELNTFELAHLAYRSPRRLCRWNSTVSCSSAQLMATRRALRKLVAKGKVVLVGRRRRRKQFCLKSHSEVFDALSLGALD